VAAEHKYDGQRAQIHRTANGDIKLFSRKIDDMTYKYPDVVTALRRCATGSLPFVLDAEIVPIISRASGPTPSDVQESEVGNVKRGEIATFQSLATRKRKNVTTANAAETSVAVKVFLFDLLLLGNEVLLRKPFSERRAAMRGQFAEECDVLAFAEVVDIDIGPSEQQRAAPSERSVAADCRVERVALEEALRSAVANSCEGLMVKRLDSVYEPSTKRSDSWLKLKKDYVDSMGDSLDLVPVGGWRGHGRKSRWISPFLVATYDPSDGTLGSVCRVMSGFSDKFYREATLRYLGKEIEVKSSAGVADADGDVDEGMCEEEEEDHLGEGVSSDSDEGKGRHPDHSDEEAVRSGCGKSLLRSGPAPGVVTGDKPSYWFEPTEVWEIRGADITVSPRHMSAQGLVDPVRGLSLRFPRFVRVRDDKRVADATTPEHFASMFRKQAQQQPEGEKRRRAE